MFPVVKYWGSVASLLNRMGALLTVIVPVPGLLLFSAYFDAVHADETWTGRRIMDEVFQRHQQYPYVFEEQTMILMDGAESRDVRKLRRFSRVENDGTVKFLLVFVNPPEVRGTALLAIRLPGGGEEGGLYLPAFGKELKSSARESRGSQFLGTDFSVGDLAAEVLADFRYVREADQKIDKAVYFVVTAFPMDKEIERATGYGLRRHLIRQDNFFITRTDYFDRRQRFFKRQTNHDLKRVDGDMWRANMILMENHKEWHKTLIKIDRRIFSHDHVPPEIFTPAWLFGNHHVQGPEKHLFRDVSQSPGKDDGGLADDR